MALGGSRVFSATILALANPEVALIAQGAVEFSKSICIVEMAVSLSHLAIRERLDAEVVEHALLCAKHFLRRCCYVRNALQGTFVVVAIDIGIYEIVFNFAGIRRLGEAVEELLEYVDGAVERSATAVALGESIVEIGGFLNGSVERHSESLLVGNGSGFHVALFHVGMTCKHIGTLCESIVGIGDTGHVVDARLEIGIAVVEHAHDVLCGALGCAFAAVEVGADVTGSLGVVAFMILAFAHKAVDFAVEVGDRAVVE